MQRIATEAPDRVMVEAYFRVPRSFFREEFYNFQREGEELYPRGVRLMPGVYSSWQPLIPPMPEAAPDPTTGYLIPSALAARRYSLKRGDTLPELAPLQVPEEVQDAAGRIVNELAWSHSCTRYFSAGEHYWCSSRAPARAPRSRGSSTSDSASACSHRTERQSAWSCSGWARERFPCSARRSGMCTGGQRTRTTRRMAAIGRGF